MELVPSNVVLVACVLSLLVMVRIRQPSGGTQAASNAERLDTVLARPPSKVTALNHDERQAYRLLRSALATDLILAHIALARFIFVPTRQSHGVWLKKAGRLSADLLVCDEDGHALAVLEVRSPDEPARTSDRRARMQRVVQAAGITVHTCGRRDNCRTSRRFEANSLPSRLAKPIPRRLPRRPVRAISQPMRS